MFTTCHYLIDPLPGFAGPKSSKIAGRDRIGCPWVLSRFLDLTTSGVVTPLLQKNLPPLPNNLWPEKTTLIYWWFSIHLQMLICLWLRTISLLSIFRFWWTQNPRFEEAKSWSLELSWVDSEGQKVLHGPTVKQWTTDFNKTLSGLITLFDATNPFETM